MRIAETRWLAAFAFAIWFPTLATTQSTKPIGAFVASVDGLWFDETRQLEAGQAVSAGSRLVSRRVGQEQLFIRLLLPFGGELSNCVSAGKSCTDYLVVPVRTTGSPALLKRLERALGAVVAQDFFDKARSLVAYERQPPPRLTLAGVAAAIRTNQIVVASVDDLQPLHTILKLPEDSQSWDLTVVRLSGNAPEQLKCRIPLKGALQCGDARFENGVFELLGRVVLLSPPRRVTDAQQLAEQFAQATAKWPPNPVPIGGLTIETALLIERELRP